MTPVGSMKGVLWEPQDHFSSYKMQKQPACWRISGRWIILTSVYYGLHWLPGCFWMLFKGLTLIYGAVYILSQKLFIQKKKKSPTVGKMKQGHCWSCSHHNFKLVSLSFVSTNSLSLGKFSPTFPPLLTRRPHREEKELFYSMVCKHHRRKLNTLVYSVLN